MTSLIFSTASGLLEPLLLLYSVYLLLGGHNEPGGGFAGGLVAAAAYTLHAIAHDVASARAALRVNPLSLMAAGLLVALVSGLVAVGEGRTFLTSDWALVPWLGAVPLELGTPLVFDMGVYLLVTGFTLTVVLSLAEE